MPKGWFGKALREVVEQFGGGHLHPYPIEGEWRHEGTIYHDQQMKLTADVLDSAANRRWMRDFKKRWKAKLEQLELWVVSYRIEVE